MHCPVAIIFTSDWSGLYLGDLHVLHYHDNDEPADACYADKDTDVATNRYFYRKK